MGLASNVLLGLHSGFPVLVSVRHVGLADVNIEHLAQDFLLFKSIAQYIESDAGAKRTLRLQEMVVRVGYYE